MRRANPVFIPRNHLVEEVIQAAYQGDMGAFEKLSNVLQAPFDYRATEADFARPANDSNRVSATFCGT